MRRGASLPGRYLVLLTAANGVAISTRIEDEAERERLTAGLDEVDQESIGWIVRTAARGVDPRELQREAAELLDTWRSIERNAASVAPPKLLHSELRAVERWARDRINDDLRELWVDSPELEARMAQALSDIAPHLLERLSVHQGPESLFERFGVESQLAKVWARRASLPSGGSLVIEPTEALVAIDVNSGRDLGASSLEETALATNVEAAREAARQLRLRDLAGIIVIDFIDMASEPSWDAVRAVLEDELALDPATTLVEGPTGFGLITITRKRARNDLIRRLSVRCHECKGRGRLPSAIEVVAEARRTLLSRAAKRPEARWRLLLHAEVANDEESQAEPLLADLRKRLAGRLEIETCETQRRAEFEILEVLS